MKRTLHFLALLFISLNLFAQAPQKISYQAVIRNSSNNLVANASVKMRISILQGSATGNAVYSELHSATTNANGLVSIEIGAGTSQQGTFSSINWGNGTYFLRTETDPTNSTNYSIVGTSQLLSVPYALHSGNGVKGVSTSGDTLFLDNGKKFLIPGIKDLNAPSTLNNGLVAYYPFNGNANDESGNGNNGTVIGSIIPWSDRFGNPNRSYSFTGNGHIQLPSINLPSFTINAWVRRLPGVDGVTVVCKHFSSSIANSSYLLFSQNNNFCTPNIYYTNTTNVPISVDALGTSWCDNQWHMLTGVLSASSLKIYFDGILINSATGGAAKSTNFPTLIGGQYSNSGVVFNQNFGQIDDIRFYNRALTQEEITYLANN